uniref:Metalloendopeptidase n=1 Tax=Trichuris muris TaxID=70415 RepID=A0A5S6R4P8_TRIMR
MKYLLLLFVLSIINQQCAADTKESVQRTGETRKLTAEDKDAETVVEESPSTAASNISLRVRSVDVNGTNTTETNVQPGMVTENVQERPLLMPQPVQNANDTEEGDGKTAVMNKRWAGTNWSVNNAETVNENIMADQVLDMESSKQPSEMEESQPVIRRGGSMDSDDSSSEEANIQGNGNHTHGHHGHNESSSSSSEEHSSSNVNIPEQPKWVRNATTNMDIWEELRTAFGFTDAHVHKYKAFMNKVRMYRRSKLGMIEQKQMGDYRNVSMGGAEGHPELFEGDILLTENQIDILSKVIDEDINGTRILNLAAIASNLASRWPTTVYYTVNGPDPNVIEAGLQKWREQTCLNFIRNDQYGGDRIEYIRGSGCYSSVGRIGGKQQVSIGYGCERVGTVCHETSHALGVWHEQSRTDRDSFVYVNYNNIEPSTVGNFERLTSNVMYLDQVPYDFGSEMHYPSKAFAVNSNQYTIQTLDSKYQQTIGQRDYPSFNDAKVLNLAYCGSVCRPLNCQNKGYADPKNCGICRCPEGLAGNLCEASRQVGCGQTDFTVGTSPVTITKSGGGTCYFLIKSNAGTRVQTTVTAYRFTCQETCSGSYFGIQAGSDIGNSVARICCGNPGTITSTTNAIIVIYQGGSSKDGVTFSVKQV